MINKKLTSGMISKLINVKLLDIIRKKFEKN